MLNLIYPERLTLSQVGGELFIFYYYQIGASLLTIQCSYYTDKNVTSWNLTSPLYFLFPVQFLGISLPNPVLVVINVLYIPSHSVLTYRYKVRAMCNCSWVYFRAAPNQIFPLGSSVIALSWTDLFNYLSIYFGPLVIEFNIVNSRQNG